MAIFTKWSNFCESLFTSLADIALSDWGLLLKETNLLQQEQILSFESKSLLRREANI